MAGDHDPELLPQEEVYIKILNTTILDQTLKLKLQNGSTLLTTHRVIWFNKTEALEVPLHYVKEHKSSGYGLFKDQMIELNLW